MNGKDTALFSKSSDEWETPQALFDMLDQEFHFIFDAAATGLNSKAPYYSSDTLETDWSFMGRSPSLGADVAIWLNPPYSKIAAFMKKAYEESLKGAIVVCLIPCRTDTRYWHDYVMRAHEIRLIRGRLKFGNSKSGAPFPSCIVIFDHSRYDKNNDPIFKPFEVKTA